MSKYLITGDKGFIGTNLKRYLSQQGYEVIGLDRPTDCCNDYIMEKVDIVVHLAAETDVRKSIEDPAQTFINNCKSTINILNFAWSCNAKVIFASSCGVRRITNSYTASKLAGESICKAFRESYGLDVNILRFSNVYGPFSLHKTSVVTKFIKAKLTDIPALIFGTGHQKRDFIHVSDVCKAIHECQGDQEVSTGVLTSINTLAELIGCEVKYSDPINGEVFNPETGNIKDEMVDLRLGLLSTYSWFVGNYEIIK